MDAKPSAVSVLLIADPGAAEGIAKHLSESLPGALTDASAPGDWHVSTRSHAFPLMSTPGSRRWSARWTPTA